MSIPHPHTTGRHSDYLRAYPVLLLLCMIFLGIFYGKVLLHPNSCMFNANGDGIKNYYVYAYYIADNPSYTHFEGHNYPFGESVLYTDGHPLLAFIVKSVSSVFPGIAAYSIGILNSFLLFSFILCATFLFLIFRELKIHPLLSVAAAFAIMVLSPQVFRLTGHYSLSYGFVIPLTIYLLMKYERGTKAMLYGLLLWVHILCCFFTHPYLGLITSSLALLYVLVQWMWNARNKNFYSLKTAALVFVSVCPLLVFYAVARLLDTHTGRTTNPYGFFEYYADIDTIFLPNHPPLRFLLKKILPAFTQTWEGWDYIGVVGIATCAAVAWIIFRSLRKRKLRSIAGNDRMIVALCAASLVLVFFSMGIPFRFLPHSYLDHFGFLKQFRAIGRFSWVFFFMVNITGIFLLDGFIKKQTGEGRKWMNILMVLVPLVVVMEGLEYHREVGAQVSRSENAYNRKYMPGYMADMLDIASNQHFQAIIPLPYYNTGSENFMKEGTDKIYTGSMTFSYYSGIPLMGNLIPRSSICESKMLMALFNEDPEPKEIGSYLRSDQPFLILYSRDSLTPNERHLLEKGRILYDGPEFMIYSLSRANLLQPVSSHLSDKDNVLPQTRYKGFLTSDTVSYFYYDGFENIPSGNSFCGSGCLSVPKVQKSVLADIYCRKFTRGKRYIASFWIHNEAENCGQDLLTNLDFSIYHSFDNQSTLITSCKSQQSLSITKNWSLVEVPFDIAHSEGSIRFVLEGRDHVDKTLLIDEIFIYPENGNYYKQEKYLGEITYALFHNNHRVSIR